MRKRVLIFIFFLFFTSLLGGPVVGWSQDFTDDLEAELEAEIGLGDQDLNNEPSYQDEFEDVDFGSEDFSEEEFGTEEFSEEDFGSEEFAEEDFGEESFDDFSDEDFSEDDFQAKEFSEDVLDEEFQAIEEAPVEPSVPIQEAISDDPIEDEDFDIEPVDPGVPVVGEPAESEEFLDPSATPEFQDAQAPILEPGLTPSEPNAELEARLYDIYINYHSSPTSESEWKTLLGSRRSESYEISRGDTLWGVSETFFGDGNYWPKVWSVNSEIANPHLIQPGNQIQFVMGTEADAPMFTVTESGGQAGTKNTPKGDGLGNLSQSDIEALISAGALSAEDTLELQNLIDAQSQGVLQEEMAAGEKSEDESVTGVVSADGANQNRDGRLLDPGVEIPPAGVISRPVLKRFPPSMPAWQSADVRGNYDDAGIDYGVRKITELKDEVFLKSYVDDTLGDSEASIIEIQGGAYIAKENDYVFVKLPKGRGRPGDRFLVTESKGKILRANPTVLSNNLGYQKRIAGLIVLKQAVKSSLQERFEVFKALVTKEINPIKKQTLLVRGNLELVNLSADNGTPNDVVAQVIGGPDSRRRNVFGRGSIIYLDRGLLDGVRRGNLLQVRANTKTRDPDTVIEEFTSVIGSVKVLKVTNRFSTAVVLDSYEPILAGDLTGQGPYELLETEKRLAKATRITSPVSSGLEIDPELDEMLNEGESESLSPAEEPSQNQFGDDFEDSFGDSFDESAFE